MKQFYRPFFSFLACGLLFLSCQEKSKSTPKKEATPNVVFILADDLGYGDVQALNPESKIPTPEINRLAEAGMVFTDAHSNSAVCTPTRYGVVTGRYAWRTRMKRGVLNGYSKHLIDPERTTVADLFKSKGYATACIGKWHLGMDLPLKAETKNSIYKIDASGVVQNGPLENGFDYFYGITASLDFPPYGYIENDRFTEKLIDSMPKGNFPAYARMGEKGPNFDMQESLDEITRIAQEYIVSKKDSPFFLYLPLTAPHKPVLPHKRFRGNTDLGDYGDFVTQVDWTVGQVLKTLKEQGLEENTLVVLTSDNGSFMHRIGENPKFPEGSAGHTEDVTKQAFKTENHQANYRFRGTKADVYEGGHRVPFLVRWPAGFTAGKSHYTITHTDFFATAAELIGADYDRTQAGEDSFSFLPLLKGEKGYSREPVINHSANGVFAIRDGRWKLVLAQGSGGRLPPKGKAFEGPYQLFDLEADPSETTNLAQAQRQQLFKMLQAFDTIHQRTETAVVHPIRP
ncbi:sulfatase family protein [Sediminicola luteus]|uniref:Sulfatase N-terminal domain-containing protein n=1 Tax=Sediminicola luteus TaxID=319238 RepID=A0A2A4G6C1_9FLAO|nr:arylsulfatase [Sediminicola luteus]PCE63981.1 hypothetical protein B7P33_12060 [Sediminicola luteus]